MPRECTVIEVRQGRDLIQIGSCARPVFFLDGGVRIERAFINILPALRLKQMPVEEWLRRREVIVTYSRHTETCRSSTSWVCLYESCGSVQDFDGSALLSNLVLRV